MRRALNHNRKPRTDGFTLLELLIAILILSIGTLAVTRTLDQSRRQIGENPARFLAQTVAANRAEELRIFGAAMGRGLPKRVQQGPYEWQIEAAQKRTDTGLYQITLTVRSEGLPGAQLVVFTTWEPSP